MVVKILIPIVSSNRVWMMLDLTYRGRGWRRRLRTSSLNEATFRYSDRSVAPGGGGASSFGCLDGKPGSFHRGRMEFMVSPVA